MEPTEGHTVKRYDAELTHLRGQVLEMGGLVLDQVNKAIKALTTQDLDEAAHVMDRDHLIDDFEVETDREVVNLIARRQPVANDLRMVIATSKAIADLERVGDEAVKIARMVMVIYGSDESQPSKPLLRDVYIMSRQATLLLRESLDAFDRLDVGRTAEIVREDEDLDEDFKAALRRLTTYVMEDHRTLGHAMNVLTIIRALERIGDHAKNIAEYVVYQAMGKDIRHSATAHP